MTADLYSYVLQLGDDALILSHRLSEWTARAPELEEDVALANIALDLLGQARLLLSYAGELSDSGNLQTEDELAFLRDERKFLNCQLVELPRGDFAATIARQLCFSSYQLELYRELSRSSDPVLAAIAAKSVKEVAYHVDHAVQWTLRLGDGTRESHERMNSGMVEMWPYTHELFTSTECTDRLVDVGIAADPIAMRPQWDQHMGDVLHEATLELPRDDGWRPSGGRQGIHTEFLGFLLAEMQALPRAHPGASW